MTDTMSVTLHDAADLSLGEFAQKPTALTPELLEAYAAVWTRGPIEMGVWECTPGTFTAERDGYTEICHIIAGRMTVIGEGEDPVDLGPGDALVMPSGWKGVWHVHEQLRKHVVIVTDG